MVLRLDPSPGPGQAQHEREGGGEEALGAPPGPRGRKRHAWCDKAAKGRFVAALGKGMRVPAAAAAAGCSRSTFQKERARDSDFAAAWDSAIAATPDADRRAGPPLRCRGEAQERFLGAVRRGAPLGQAAEAAGFALNSFYNARRRDPGFAEAWEAAVEASAGPVWAPPPAGAPPPVSHRARRRRGLRKGRRLRLTARRQAAFLESLERTCNVDFSADAAGIDVSTVYRRLGRDPDFERRVAEALARGYAFLDGVVTEERRAAAARAAEARAGALLPDLAPIGEPPTDFETQMRLLRRWRRRAERGVRWTSARFLRRPAPSFDETLAALERRLKGLLIPVEEEGGDGGAPRLRSGRAGREER